MKNLAIGPIGEPLTLPNGTTVPLSPAYAAGNLVFLSGQLAFDADIKIVSGGIVEQTQQCLKNIESLLLELGLCKTDIVKSTVWLVAKEDFQGFNKAYTAFFEDHRPARSCVCSRLLVDGALIEIEVVAMVKD